MKQEASAILKAAELDVGTAIRLFLRSVVEKRVLPMNGVDPTRRSSAREVRPAIDLARRRPDGRQSPEFAPQHPKCDFRAMPVPCQLVCGGKAQ